MSARQRGASLLIPVLLVITIGAFAVVVAVSQSGADIQGTDAQAESTEALFLAETGVERAARRFLAGAVCSNAGLSENLADLTTIGITAGRTITITAGANSVQDFSGAALPATQCRIQAKGLITTTNVSRTVQAIIDRSDNFIGGPLVAGFNNPAGAVNPAASWTGGAYDLTGGNIAGAVNPANCTRSAYAVKPRTGGAAAAASSAGTAPVSFTINRPATVLVTFDYRILRIGNSGSNACVTAGGAACPGALDVTSPEAAGTGDGQICFTLRDTAGANYNSTRSEVDFAQNLGAGVTVTAAGGCAPTTQRLPTNAAYTPCSLRYNISGTGGGAVVGQGRARFTFLGAGTLSFDRIGFNMWIPTAGGTNAFEMWLDNIVVTPNAVIAGIGGWRDCSVSTCPAV